MSLLGMSGKESPLSVIKDPFSKNKIENVHLHITKKWVGEGYNFSGTVEFQNGNTKGKQRFTGESFDDVVMQIKAMIDSL